MGPSLDRHLHNVLRARDEVENMMFREFALYLMLQRYPPTFAYAGSEGWLYLSNNALISLRARYPDNEYIRRTAEEMERDHDESST